MTRCKKKECQFNERLGIIGGQAVIEGIMMLYKRENRCALVIRQDDGTLYTEQMPFHSIRERIKWLGWPIIRGVSGFIETLILSFRTLSKSAEIYGEEETPSKFELWLEKKFGKSLMDIVMVIASVLAVILAAGLFMFLPTFLTKLIDSWVGGLGWWRNLIEGLVKIGIFVAYMWAVSLMKDIRRTYEYHGAEHKCIYCFEAGELMTPENVRKYTRFHPRCGTSFIFVVLIVSILIFSLPFVTWDNIALRMVTKLLLLPLVVGICYEFLMYAGCHDNLFVRICSAPGLMMQRLTTREPDDDQLKVAITAMKLALPERFAYMFPREDAADTEA